MTFTISFGITLAIAYNGGPMPPYASAASNMLMSLQHIIRYSNTALVNPSNPYNRANSMRGALFA